MAIRRRLVHRSRIVHTYQHGAGARAGEALVRKIDSLGLRALSGEGADPAGLWTAEPSLLILGIDRRRAEGIGRDFGQIAIVFTAEDCIPELIVTLSERQ